MRELALVGCLAFAMPAVGGAQDAAPGSAQIAGRVVDDATSEPLAGVRVFLYPIPVPDGGRIASVVTAADGGFVFSAVGAGGYRLGTNRRGFYSTRGGAVVTLSGAHDRVAVQLTMAKGGAVAGRLVDQTGSPLTRAWVGALRVVGPGEVEQAIPSPAVARTNDRGEYRVESLQPGDYVIIANPGHGPIGPAAGGVRDSRTFFPGTLDFAVAQRVTIGEAPFVSGLDFTMLTAPTFEVAGRAVHDDGRPAPGVEIALIGDWSLFGGRKGSCRTDAEGRFRIAGLTAGRYKLTVPPPDDRPRRANQDAPSIRLTVVDGDVTGLVVPVPIR
jgi:5-hydroxyisourate hydrolase-like protein (transthyretin family)